MNPITVTKSAIEIVKTAIQEENMGGSGLRVAVKGEGCAGLSYELDFSNRERIGDTVFEVDGLTVYIDFASLKYLQGTTIDYRSNELSSGFVFENPNELPKCCCH